MFRTASCPCLLPPAPAVCLLPSAFRLFPQEPQRPQEIVGEGQVGREAERGEVFVRRREGVTEVTDFIEQARARAQVEAEAADCAKRLELRAVEHPSRDLARQTGRGSVGPRAST